MTQAELGRILGVGNKAVSSYEKGAANPSPSSLAEIARLGKCTIDWLVTGVRPDAPTKPLAAYPIGEDEIGALKTCENLISRYGLEKQYAVVEIHHPPPQDEKLSDDEKQLLSAYRCASDEIREEAFGMLERSARRSQGSGGGENGLCGKKSA